MVQRQVSNPKTLWSLNSWTLDQNVFTLANPAQPLSNEYGTYKTVKARLWRWPGESGTSLADGKWFSASCRTPESRVQGSVGRVQGVGSDRLAWRGCHLPVSYDLGTPVFLGRWLTASGSAPGVAPLNPLDTALMDPGSKVSFRHGEPGPAAVE